MEKATKAQITKLHILLVKLDLIKDKKAIVMDASDNRTSSSKELTISEAKKLIALMCNCDPGERLKSAITQLAFKAGITYGNTDTDKILNKVKLDMFLNKNGSVKKDLQKQSYTELIKTHRQLEAIVKGVSKSNDMRAAERLVNGLINELELPTIKPIKKHVKNN